MDPFIGEIRMVGFNFAPTGWAFCNGQLLPISQYQALFALLGTTYGGNGTTNFQLPNLQGRFPTGFGNGQGFSPVIGEIGGVPSVTLTQAQMPAHTHAATFAGAAGTAPTLAVASVDATLSDPNGNILAKLPGTGRGNYQNIYAPASGATSGAKLGGVTGGNAAGTVTVTPAGGSVPVNTLPPYLGINFIIALQGVFPSRN